MSPSLSPGTVSSALSLVPFFSKKPQNASSAAAVGCFLVVAK